jgi:hypothetical protein
MLRKCRPDHNSSYFLGPFDICAVRGNLIPLVALANAERTSCDSLLFIYTYRSKESYPYNCCAVVNVQTKYRSQIPTLTIIYTLSGRHWMQTIILRNQRKSGVPRMYATPVRDAQKSSRMQFGMAFISLALLAFVGALDAPLLAPALPVRDFVLQLTKQDTDIDRSSQEMQAPQVSRLSG